MLTEHLGYVADAVRLEHYRAAIHNTLPAGASVADLGCGSGVLGLLCLQAGAGHIFAVDDSAILEVARAALQGAGYGARTSFIRGTSSQVSLPQQVDMVICDHVGYFGFDYGIIGFLEDARKRLLKPGGTLIPSRIQLNLAAIDSQPCGELANAWQADNIPPAFHWLRGHRVNTKHAVMLEPADLLCPPAVLGEIDLYADQPGFFSWSAELHIERDGVVHGLGGWFTCELAQGVWMTNSPLVEQPIRRNQAFLPIEEAVAVRAGDRVKATIMVRPGEHLLAWVVEFPATCQRFAQSTWQGRFLTPAQLLQANPQRVPRLGRTGRATAAVLGYCDGQKTVAHIQAAVLRDHPDLFPTAGEIANFVAKVLGRDCEP